MNKKENRNLSVKGSMEPSLFIPAVTPPHVSSGPPVGETSFSTGK
jgi:hypothetical protein